MARTGMTNLITELRTMTNAGNEDYQIAGTYYFDDDQLQAELDKTQVYAVAVPLTPIPIPAAGATSYTHYTWPAEIGVWIEDYAGNTTSGWAVKDSVGNTQGTTLYSANIQARRITFVSDTAGSAYMLEARYYDLNKAAANVWRWKAAHVANKVDWQSDNHRISASQEVKACLDMAKFYQSQSGISTGQLIRSDENMHTWYDNFPVY